MTNDPSSYSKRVRKLSLALMASGALNIGVLSLLLFWVVKERPPTPYCELKPASKEQQQVPLADHRGCTEVLAQLSGQTFLQLAAALSHPKLIENGFTERDLALACLMAFHHFDIQRALPKNAQPQQPRYLSWKPKDQAAPIILTVFSDLTQAQFDAMIQFIKTERWPFTGEGLFGLLKKQKEERQFDDHLVETFVLTPEFWTVELLFNRSGQKANRKEMLRVLLEGDWALLSRFVDQQRVAHDSSDARRQKFLLDYINAGSPSAAGLLLKAEWDFALKKIDDHQVIAILRLMPNQTAEGTLYAKEMLASPRSTNVWRESSRWLYVQAGETFPNEWTHHAALAKFVPEKAVLELVTKPPPPLPIAPPPIPIVAVIPDKTVKATPIKPDNPAQPKKVQTKIVKAKEVPKKDQVKRGGGCQFQKWQASHLAKYQVRVSGWEKDGICKCGR